MSLKLPSRVDPYRAAERELLLDADLAVKRCERLGDLLSPTHSGIAVHLRFSAGPIGTAIIEGQLDARLLLTCQRCLERFEIAIDTPLRIAAIPNAGIEPVLPAGFDAIVVAAHEELDLIAAIEDELLLNLPPVPRHADRSACEAVMSRLLEPEFDPDATVVEPQDNPFTQLKGLIKADSE